MRKPEKSGPRLKLMFVDDDPQVLELFRSVAEPLGCDVRTFADSREAAAQVQKEKFDGIFVDAQMPHPDGFELARMVRHSPSNSAAPIAMVTGYDDALTMRQAFEAGVTSFLGKPVTPWRLGRLLMVMRGAIGREKGRPARLPLITRVFWSLGDRRCVCESRNISESGMLIEGWPLMPVGQQLELEFVIPKGCRRLKSQVKVVRRELPNRVAVQFLHLGKNDLQLVQQYLRVDGK